MARLSTPGPKITQHSIQGAAGAVYECPDLAAIDKHLAQLSLRISVCNEKMKNTKRALLEDRDCLLGYRLLLASFLAEEAAS